jgi:hypothetical protein
MPYKGSILFAEGRSREASCGWRRMRRLRLGFATPAITRLLRNERQVRSEIAARAGPNARTWPGPVLAAGTPKGSHKNK